MHNYRFIIYKYYTLTTATVFPTYLQRLTSANTSWILNTISASQSQNKWQSGVNNAIIFHTHIITYLSLKKAAELISKVSLYGKFCDMYGQTKAVWERWHLFFFSKLIRHTMRLVSIRNHFSASQRMWV